MLPLTPANKLISTTAEFLKRLGDSWTPEMAGSALVDLVRADPACTAMEYLLTGGGL